MCPNRPELEHTCKYSQRLEWDDWYEDGSLRRRVARDIPRCKYCDSIQPARRPRTPTREQAKARNPKGAPAPSPEGKEIAKELVRLHQRTPDQQIRFVGLSGRMLKRDVQPGLLERLLEDLVEAGWLSLEWKLDRTRRELFAVQVLDPSGLEDYANPGLREERETALSEARKTVAKLDHPTAELVRNILSGDEGERADPVLIRALAAVSAHVFAGDVLAERVFSARYLDDSKALAAIRRRLEKLVGPLGQLGIREGGAVTLIGGEGSITIRGSRIDLPNLRPFVGLSREALLDSPIVSFPAGGLLVVENLTAFEACCRGEVAGADSVLLVWSGGYPGRGVKALADAATSCGTTTRVWADIDLDGIRIARLVCGWGGANCTPWRMNSVDLLNSPRSKALMAKAKVAIEKDLQVHGDALLAETLKTLLGLGRWVEQEMLLGTAHKYETGD